MKNTISLVLSILFSLGIVNAQTSFNLNPNPRTQPLKLTSQDTLKILAVMVEFKEDNDANTFGNGKFGSIYSQDYGADILDPLPHNAAYFESHLEFVKNYYSKVSNGQLNISYDVMPNIVTVSKIIRDYSPAPESDDFTGLGEFAEEVWRLADQSTQINFAEYDLFTIFHAGVGREIPTPGSIGLERDIPSVFLSENSLKNIFGDAFDGFPVDGGNFKITNTAILPSTENREIESFGEIYLQEFTINGLIVGTVASYIGLPDLFNTETGLSAIGRFGLMDGQALFAYSGLFPPEPSAWEKIYLGWAAPTEVSLENQTIDITTFESATETDNTIIKIPINSNEYYLIENRKRDANKDGITLTYKIGSSTNTITFDKDYPGFSPFGADTIIGVVTDVDEFDWALPGFEENQTFDDPFEDIGFIIWHIDEEIINQNIESNTINNNRDRLGVRVVEADGIFDIGEEFTNIFGETIIGEGTKQDTWYKSNPSLYYLNRFDATTKPPAISNLGANSLIKISNISSIGNTMSFDFSVSSGGVQLLYTVNLEDNPVQVSQLSEFTAVRNSNGDVSLINNAGNNLGTLPEFSSFEIASLSTEDADFLFGAFDDSLKVFEKKSVEENQSLSAAGLSAFVSAPVVISNSQTGIDIYIGLNNGQIEHFTYNGSSSAISFVESFSAFSGEAVKQIALSNGTIAAISNSSYWSSAGQTMTLGDSLQQLALSRNDNGDFSAVILGENEFYVLGLVNNELVNNFISKHDFKINTSENISSFALGDIFGDGNNYIIFNNGNKLEVRNLTGAPAASFPSEFKNEAFSSSPLAFDITGDGKDEILTFSKDGNIYLIGNNGEPVNPFPISSGNGAVLQPVVDNNIVTQFTLVNESNIMYVWKLSDNESSISWGNKYGNFGNSASVGIAGTSNKTSTFFPLDKAYNWPNPVYGDETYIRFFVSENAEAEVKIFDLAGDFVAELFGQAVGGMDNEITWDVSDIQSGVYFAQLTVTRNGGSTETKLIKIAVIK